jgi:hypothetical protein
MKACKSVNLTRRYSKEKYKRIKHYQYSKPSSHKDEPERKNREYSKQVEDKQQNDSNKPFTY